MGKELEDAKNADAIWQWTLHGFDEAEWMDIQTHKPESEPWIHSLPTLSTVGNKFRYL